MQMNL